MRILGVFALMVAACASQAPRQMGSSEGAAGGVPERRDDHAFDVDRAAVGAALLDAHQGCERATDARALYSCMRKANDRALEALEAALDAARASQSKPPGWNLGATLVERADDLRYSADAVICPRSAQTIEKDPCKVELERIVASLVLAHALEPEAEDYPRTEGVALFDGVCIGLVSASGIQRLDALVRETRECAGHAAEALSRARIRS